MKKISTSFIFALLLLAIQIPLKATILPDNNPPGKNIKPENGIPFFDIFRESWLFTPKSNNIWGDYQLISTRGKRPDFTRQLFPPVGLNYERHIWNNFGARLSLATHWWEEDKALVQSSSQIFTELFRYQYWTVGAGLTYHFNITEKFDPYIGYMGAYRYARAACDCVEESRNLRSDDYIIGVRFFPLEKIYLSAELGHHGVGYVKFGLGFKIGESSF
jgi:hypothetical protein